MGVVYLATHLELQQSVALKVLTSDVLGTSTAVDRFLREARTTASLGHPNIVRVTDLGKLDDGRPFLVMERLEGTSFDALLASERRLPVERVATLIAGAAAALDAIHQVGLVHRDVKPENLFLAKNLDGNETVKLVDFGLVGMSRPDLDERRITQTGLIYGTPAYMAPETLAERTPSPKWDVYSLAVVAFELLTGKVPFETDIPLESLARRMVEDPPKLSDIGDATFDEAVEKAVRRGLSRFADARFESAGDFARALGGSIAASAEPQRERQSEPQAEPRANAPSDSVVTVGRPSVGTPTRSFAPEDDEIVLPGANRRPAVLVGAVVVLVGVGALILAVLGEVEPDEQLVAVVADASSDAPTIEEPRASTAVQAPSVVVDAGSAPRDAGAEGSEAVRDDGTMRRRRRTVPDAPTMTSEEEPVSAEVLATREREANRALARGNLTTARDAFQAVVDDAPRRASAWRGLGVVSERLGRRADAVNAYRRYLALAPDARDGDSVRERLARLAP
jgi:serine/threonine-protein kinase